jgi:hypothetical protein
MHKNTAVTVIDGYSWLNSHQFKQRSCHTLGFRVLCPSSQLRLITFRYLNCFVIFLVQIRGKSSSRRQTHVFSGSERENMTAEPEASDSFIYDRLYIRYNAAWSASVSYSLSSSFSCMLTQFAHRAHLEISRISEICKLNENRQWRMRTVAKRRLTNDQVTWSMIANERRADAVSRWRRWSIRCLRSSPRMCPRRISDPRHRAPLRPIIPVVYASVDIRRSLPPQVVRRRAHTCVVARRQPSSGTDAARSYVRNSRRDVVTMQPKIDDNCRDEMGRIKCYQETDGGSMP